MFVPIFNNFYFMQTNMSNFILKFGKYKGHFFTETPLNYQEWLLKQNWFKPLEEKMPRISKNWNGYSKKGESQEWAVFEWEKKQAKKLDCLDGICSCCPDSKYYNM